MKGGFIETGKELRGDDTPTRNKIYLTMHSINRKIELIWGIHLSYSPSSQNLPVTCKGAVPGCDRAKPGFGWFQPRSGSDGKFLGMDVAGPETNALEDLADGIHHGRRAADEDGCVAAASRKKLL